MAKKEEEEKEGFFTSLFSFICYAVASFYLIQACIEFDEASNEFTEAMSSASNSVASKRSDFKIRCWDIETKTLEYDIKEVVQKKNLADIKKKEAEQKYKQGLITESMYREAEENSFALLSKFTDYNRCLEAKNEYKKVMEESIKEGSDRLPSGS